MKKLLFFSLAALLAAGMSSCNKDDAAADGGGKPLEEDTTFFVNIAIGGGSDITTRAYDSEDYDPSEEPEFDKGDDKENKVNTVYLIFYDKDGNRVSTTQVLTDNANSNGTFPDQDGKVDSRNHFYKGIVQIDVKHGSLPPAYVMAFVNPITSQNFEINPEFESLDALSRTTRPRIMGENGNFAMSKSVYYGKNRVTGDEHAKIVATPLTSQNPQQLFKSAAEAEAKLDDENSVVDIYVERYAAKVSLELKNDVFESDISVLTINETKLTFEPEYWAVNAYESDTYIVKSFLKADAVADGGLDAASTLTFQELNAALGGTEGDQMPWYWNSEENHRCYWAQTPAYYANRYPRTADDINDNGAGTYALGYYSYDDMVNNATKSLNAKARNLQSVAKGGEAGTTRTGVTTIYARENTVAGSSLHDAYDDQAASPKAAIASVVIVGHYELNGEPLDDDEFFYVRGNATNGYSLYDEEEMLNYFVSSTVRFATDIKGDNPIFEYETDDASIGEFLQAQYKDYFVIKHPDKAVRKDLVVDSRFVTIQLKPEKFSEDGNNFFAFINGEYVEVTSKNIDEVNEQMFFAAGTVQGYQGGKAYYSIPIKHLGFYRDGNENEDKTGSEKDFNWKAVRSGDFGLVRNHSYKIIVDKIEGLGNAIPDPTDPIVPPTDPEEYFIGARLIILNWAVVPDQSVTL